MFIIKVLGVYFIIFFLGVIREILVNKVFGDLFGVTEEGKMRFDLTLAILFAAIIIREGLW